MPLITNTPAQFFTSITNAITALYTRRSPSQGPLNFTSGSILGAMMNAVVAWLFFLQNQIAYVYSVTRAGTSVGADLTSWGADYGMSPARVLATYAISPSAFALATNVALTVAYNVPASAQSVNGAAPVGNGLVLQDTSTPPSPATQFVVVTDLTNPNYNSGLQAYVAPIGTTSLTVTCQALAAGSAGNAVAGTIQKIVTGGSPFTAVVQSQDCTNGQGQETDIALRVRQLNYVGALAKASKPSLTSAILALQPGLTFTIVETPPAFQITVDDGSGAIPNGTITSILAIVNADRAAGSGPATVVAPTNVPITIVINGTTAASGFSIAAVRAAVQAAIVASVNTNGVAGANASNGYAPTYLFSYTALLALLGSFVGLGANQGLLTPYTSATINGASSDVVLTYYQLARTSAASVTVM